MLVEDNGLIHVSKIALAALNATQHGSPSSGCPNTQPELNDIEVVWRHSRRHHPAHQISDHVEALDRGIDAAVEL